MIIAWPLMGIIGMFFASWMKPALPNGEWLQVQLVVHVKSNLIPRPSSRPGHEANVKSKPSSAKAGLGTRLILSVTFS